MSSFTSSLTEDEPGPRLPYELIELIIHEAWLSHTLTLRERIAMFASFSLVSLDFAWEFTRIHMSHVHIFNHAHFKHFIHHTCHNDTVFLQKMSKVGRRLDARTSCRSITTHSDDPELDIDMLDVLDTIASIIRYRFERVHRFGVVYHDWTVLDGNLMSIALPKQVEVLEIIYVRSAKLASHNGEKDFEMCTTPRRWRFSGLSNIHRLEVYGGNAALMDSLTKMCPNARAVNHILP